MRNFSIFEQKLIKKLVNLEMEESNIADFITDNILKNRMIQFERYTKKITLVNRTIDDKNKFLTELVETFSLIKYLEENNLVFIHEDPNILSRNQGNSLIQKSDDFKFDVETKSFVNKEGKKIDVNITFTETSLHDSLIRYTYTFFTPGTEIKALVDNNFVSSEQKKHSQVLFWTRAAFLVALIPALVSVSEKANNTFFSAKKSSLEEIHTDLIDINQSINSKSLPNIIKTEITNDSLKVIIKKSEKEISPKPVQNKKL